MKRETVEATTVISCDFVDLGALVRELVGEDGGRTEERSRAGTARFGSSTWPGSGAEPEDVVRLVLVRPTATGG